MLVRLRAAEEERLAGRSGREGAAAVEVVDGLAVGAAAVTEVVAGCGAAEGLRAGADGPVDIWGRAAGNVDGVRPGVVAGAKELV